MFRISDQNYTIDKFNKATFYDSIERFTVAQFKLTWLKSKTYLDFSWMIKNKKNKFSKNLNFNINVLDSWTNQKINKQMERQTNKQADVEN